MISCSTLSNNCLLTAQILASPYWLILLSISGQTHEFIIIYVMRQGARADIRQFVIDVSFSCVCPIIDNEFRHNIVKVVCGSARL